MLSSQSREVHKFFAKLIAIVFAEFFFAKFRIFSQFFAQFIFAISWRNTNKNFRIFSRKFSCAGNKMENDCNISSKFVKRQQTITKSSILCFL